MTFGIRVVLAAAAVLAVCTALDCSKETWLRACQTGDLTSIDKCSVEHPELLKAADEAGCSPVVVAAINNQLDAIKHLVQAGALVDGKCRSGMTALMFAAQSGRLPAVKLLKTLGANEHLEVPSSGFTALTFAARQGHIEIVRFLHRLDTSLGEGWSGTGLMWAAAVGETSLVKSLLAKGGPVDDRDDHGFTAAMWAAQNGQVEAIDLLHAHGANLEATSIGGWTPLMGASYHGHDGMVAYLLKHGVKVDTGDRAGWTAMFWAAANGKVAVMDQLYAAGAAINAKPGQWSPLLVAAVSGQAEAVQWLLTHGAEHNQANHEGKTAEQLARTRAFVDIANTLERIRHTHSYHAERTQKTPTADEASAEERLERAKRQAQLARQAWEEQKRQAAGHYEL